MRAEGAAAERTTVHCTLNSAVPYAVCRMPYVHVLMSCNVLLSHIITARVSINDELAVVHTTPP